MGIYGKHTGIHKPGDFLALDERTGKEMWRSELDIDWDGTLADKDRLDHKHPDFEKKVLPFEKMPYRTSPPVNQVATVTAGAEQAQTIIASAKGLATVNIIVTTSGTPSGVPYPTDSPTAFLFGS